MCPVTVRTAHRSEAEPEILSLTMTSGREGKERKGKEEKALDVVLGYTRYSKGGGETHALR